MTIRFERILPKPDEISDETAAMLTKVLFRLAGVCDQLYGEKILNFEHPDRYGDPKLPRNRTTPT